MSSWNDVARSAPALATDVRGRFEAHGLGLLATLRADGSPRISGVEPAFTDEEVWLGMMWESRKAMDLRRDPRLSLHSATIDTQVSDGDARLSGRAVEIVDPDAIAAARSVFTESSGNEPPPGPFHLFRIEVVELLLLTVVVDHLLIRTWDPERGERSIERR